VREFERSLAAFKVITEGATDDETAVVLKTTSYYLVELAKRWGDGRTMPIEKAIKKSDIATRAWLRKRADRELERELKKTTGLAEALAGTPSSASSLPSPPAQETPTETASQETPSPEVGASSVPADPGGSPSDPQTAPPRREAPSQASPGQARPPLVPPVLVVPPSYELEPHPSNLDLVFDRPSAERDAEKGQPEKDSKADGKEHSESGHPHRR